MHYLSVSPSPPDEKERFDPTQFQESIVQGLNQTGTDLDAVAKFLDASGAKLDYRRYAETLFDILVAGGMLGKSPTCLSRNWFALLFYIGPRFSHNDGKLKEKSVMQVSYCVFPCAAPGGTLSDDMTRTDYCLFTAQEDLETMQAYAQVNNTGSPLVQTLLKKKKNNPCMMSL